MGRLYTFLLGVVIGFGLYHAAINYHLVHASDGLHLVAKQPPRLAEFYIDIRTFGVADWQEHPALILALEKAGKRHLLREAAGDAIEDLIDGGLERVLPPVQPEG